MVKFDVQKFKRLAKKKGISVKLVSRRKQLSGPGRILDFDIKGSKINRIKVATSRTDKESNANLFSGSRKRGFEFKSVSQLVKKIKKK